MSSNNNNSNNHKAAASKKKSSDLLVASPTAGFAPRASRGGGMAMETATSSSASSRNVGSGENDGGQSSTTAAVAVAASSPAPATASTAASNTTKVSKAKTTKKRSSSKRGSSNSTTAAATASSALGGSLHSLGGSGGFGEGDNNNNNNNYSQETTVTPLPTTIISSTFTPISLSQIQLRIKLLLDKLPNDLDDDVVPEDYNVQQQQEDSTKTKLATIKQFASSLQQIIEEYNLLLSLVSSSTYQWGVDRSGASQQNLSVMSSELQQCQEVLTSVVSGRLSNVLCPAVDVLIGSVEIVRGGNTGDDSGVDGVSGDYDDFRGGKKRKLDGNATSSPSSAAAMNVDSTRNSNNNNNNKKNEQRINHYTRPLVDPSYVHLCYQILARNSSMIRYTVATCIHTAQRVIGDYLHAMKKDVGHEASKGGYY